jgi:dihydropteroate synthase
MLIEFQEKPYWVMGVVNITPDSFSDGGQFFSSHSAVAHAMSLIEQGADILDLGGESTRPGAEPVSVDQELARVLPVLTALRQHTDIPISIDTSQPLVMQACLAAGASMINDVRALQVLGAAEALVPYDQVPVCLMHMQGDPKTMQAKPCYESVVDEVIAFFQQRIDQLLIERTRILLDPGFGFGKTLEQNIALFKAIPRLASLGYPLLIGVSRKTMIGQLTAQPQPQLRQAGSVAAAVKAVRLGAKVVRVHDVRETVDALTVTNALSALN